MQHQKLLPIAKAARACGLSAYLVNQLVKAGTVPALRMPSGRRLIDPADLQAALKQA